jgi:hypothetical protein
MTYTYTTDSQIHIPKDTLDEVLSWFNPTSQSFVYRGKDDCFAKLSFNRFDIETQCWVMNVNNEAKNIIISHLAVSK